MSTPASSAAVSALGSRLADIGAELRRWRVFWSAHAFREPVLCWESELPELAGALRALAAKADSPAEAELRAEALLGRWFPVNRWRQLEDVSPTRGMQLRAWPRGMEREIPGRKWAQVVAFVAAMQHRHPVRAVDWCSGKAHLGRAIAAQWDGCEVLALERDPALVHAARELSRRDGLTVWSECCDVLTEAVTGFLDPEMLLLGLHACGELHRRLLDVAIERQVLGIACAPCCFHLGPDGHLPRSAAGRDADPGIAARDLRTAVQEVVTAGGHARRRRVRLQTWQLGFDAMLREAHGKDGYTPVPTASSAGRAGDFPSFCNRAAESLGLSLPSDVVFGRWEERGRERFREVGALDCVRRQFRRLLEVWLVTDLAVSLEEAGYSVRLERFCDERISPRNLLLQAARVA